MEASSYEDGEDEINVNEGSLNQTANSIHFESSEKDKEMASINCYLIRFIRQQLEVGIKFDNLQQNRLICDKKPLVIQPIPWVYYLPHTILFTSQRQNMEELYDKLEALKRNDYIFSLDRDKKEVKITVHNESEMCFYNLRILKTESRLHRDPRMLDSKFLVDKLYEYYEHFYQKLYFRETMILVLFWAHQRDLLDHIISEEALKLLVICIFVNYGYGVNNIVHVQSENKEKIKTFKRMSTYARMNARGETQIMEQLLTQFESYTIQEKRGFYMASKKKFMQIKDIVPIYFPILPLEREEEDKFKQDIEKAVKAVIEHEKENMSICKNLAKLFKFLHNKFEKQMKLVVDFGQKMGYRHEYCQNFELQVIHPVLNTSICKLKDSPIKSLKHEINLAYQHLIKINEPIETMVKLFEKARP